MVLTCVLDGCGFKYRPNTTCHRIPANPATREKWIEFIRGAQNDPSWTPRKSSALCSGHFEPKSFYVSGLGLRLIKYTVPKFIDPSTDRGPLGSINYVQNVLDPSTVAIAALLLKRLASPYVCRSLNVTLGIDDNGSDSISYAEIDTPLKPQLNVPVTLTHVQDLQNDSTTEMSLTKDNSQFCSGSTEISPHSSTNSYGNLPSTSALCYKCTAAEQFGHICPTHGFGYERTELSERVHKDHAYANSITKTEHTVDLRTKLRKAQTDLKVSKTQSRRRKRRILKLNSVIKNMDALFFVKDEVESKS